MGLPVALLGPFDKGIVENATPAGVSATAARVARNVALKGAGKVVAAPGTEVAMSFVDDQATPAAVTSIRAVQPFADNALVVGYSSVTQKVYLYRIATDFTGWYNAAGALQSTTTAQPVGVIWPAATEAAVTAAPDVTIAEGLGTAYFATPASLSATSLNYRLRSYTVSGGLADVTSNLGGTGAKPVYALGCISFQQHLWIWGYGSDTDRFRPELLRFSGINFDPAASPDGLFARSDSITLGDRVRSKRERVIGAGLAGDALIVAGTTVLARITGYGRDSWYRMALDKSYGMAGGKAGVTHGDTFYYWAPQHGPMRVSEEGPPTPLWPRVDRTAKAIPNESTIVAGYDTVHDQVLFCFDSGAGAGVRLVMAYDAIRDAWFGPDSDIGIDVGCMGTVERVLDPSVVLPPPGAPTGLHTVATSTTTDIEEWSLPDAASEVEVSWKPSTQALWGGAPLVMLASGTTSYSFTDLTPGTGYDYRLRAKLNGQFSAYATGAFTTNASGGGGTPLAPPTSPAASCPGSGLLTCSWVNGTPSASTEVWLSGPNTNASYSLRATRSPGYASYTQPFLAPGVWYAKYRHNDGTNVSVYTAEVSATVI